MMLCNLDGPMVWEKETETTPASVGMVCKWGGITIAEISSDVPEGERDEYARLFAAAPELYAACEEFVRKVDSGEARSTRSYEQMEKALAKARGEQ